MKTDWILLNIKNIIKERDIKLENFAKSLGISVGEFSKILNGQRHNYYKHLPAISEILEIDFLDLVKPNDAIRETDDKTSGNIGSGQFPTDPQILIRLFDQYEETIKSKEAMIQLLLMQDHMKTVGHVFLGNNNN